MDTAAPAALLFRRRSTLDRLRLDPALEIGAGGEAVVYGVPGDGSLVAKLYHEPSIDRARKLAAMVSHPPSMPLETAIAWPADVLLAERGGFAGFLMPRAEGPRVFEFYNPVSRRGTAPGFHAGLLHRAGRNLAAAFHALHAAGYVVGDVNESNLLVDPRDAAVTIVDADSLQVRDGEGGSVFRSRVGKPEFTPPELLGVDFGQVDRTPEHDRFGLAVLVYLLLMEGTHPFAARMEATREAVPVEERIRQGLFPHARADDDCHPPRLSPPFEALHPPLRELFLRAFVAGHADPAARPTCAEWRDALEAAEAVLVGCPANPRHRFAPHLYSCPWCARRALLGGRDPFPSHADAAPRPRPSRSRAPSAFPAAHAPRPAAPPVVTPYGTRIAFASQPIVPAAGQAVGPMGMMRPSGPPAPDVFSSSGVLNPLVILGPAAILTFTGGTVGMISLLVAFAAVAALATFAWKNVRVSTVVIALAATIFTATLASLAYAASSVSSPTLSQAAAPLSPTGATGGLAPLADPLSMQNVDDFMVGELVSTPIHEHDFTSGGGPVPAPSDAQSVDVRLLDRWPRLKNNQEAAQALAGAYASFAPDRARPDTAVIWLRVEPDGTVAMAQVVRATSGETEQAARVGARYLRFEPGQKDGVAYAAWVVMRFVIVP